MTWELLITITNSCCCTKISLIGTQVLKQHMSHMAARWKIDNAETEQQTFDLSEHPEWFHLTHCWVPGGIMWHRWAFSTLFRRLTHLTSVCRSWLCSQFGCNNILNATYSWWLELTGLFLGAGSGRSSLSCQNKVPWCCFSRLRRRRGLMRGNASRMQWPHGAVGLKCRRRPKQVDILTWLD